jgi:S-adenosylmethionine hydrolase
MKGVIAKIAPGVPMVDLSHEIPPGDVRRGAVTLWQAQPYFPEGTIFLVVVDPGVGTTRRPILIHTQSQTFIGPDNGVFSFLLDDGFECWELEAPAYRLSNPGMTFHGRDIFAPAAGYAAKGVPGSDFGPPVGDLVRLPPPELSSPAPGMIQGEVLHADQFGNLLTSLGCFEPQGAEWMSFKPWCGSSHELQISSRGIHLQLPNGMELPWVKTFAEIPPGRCAALLGSSGLVEIAANRQSAEEILSIKSGEMVKLVYPSPEFEN